GYFRSMPWMIRYAGNEPAGIKISTAYHILNNVTGLHLIASTNAPGADISATGRQAATCSGCHYSNWFALDKTASVLTKVVRTGQTVTFTPKTVANDAPQTILGNITVTNDKELVTALLANDSFPFATCRLAWNYLYGRDENKC